MSKTTTSKKVNPDDYSSPWRSVGWGLSRKCMGHKPVGKFKYGIECWYDHWRGRMSETDLKIFTRRNERRHANRAMMKEVMEYAA